MKKTNPNLIHLVKLLSDGQNHDGTRLGEKLGVSRAAVSKKVNKLKGLDVEIESKKGLGYCMSEPLQLLDEKKIKRALTSKVSRLDVFESIDSTNAYLMAEHESGVHVVLAEMQNKGRGRMARTWVSPFAKNIMLSVKMPIEKDLSELAGLSLAVALDLAKTIKKVSGIKQNIMVKWPNDLYCEGKKIAGILMELSAEAHGGLMLVIGIGLNCNMDLEENIDQPFTSLKALKHEYVDRHVLVCAMIDSIIDCVQRFCKKGFEPFLKLWPSYDYLIERELVVEQFGKTIKGVMKGINEQGHMLIEKKDGMIVSCASGDTKIKK